MALASHAPGYMVQHNTGFSSGINFNSTAYEYHVFRLAISDNSSSSNAIVRLEITDTSDNLIVGQDFYPQSFTSSNVYQEFVLQPIPTPTIVRYRVMFYGGRDVKINKISAMEGLAESLIINHTNDGDLQTVVNTYAPWRFVVYDEPSWIRLESIGYIEDFWPLFADDYQVFGHRRS